MFNWDTNHDHHPRPIAYIAAVDGGVDPYGRTGYGVVLVAEDGTEETSFGESETYSNWVAVVISGILKALSMAQEKNIPNIVVVLDEINIGQFEAFVMRPEAERTRVLSSKLAESPVKYSVKMYDTFKFCQICGPKHSLAWRLARIGSGTHSTSLNPINNNLYKNGVIGVAIGVLVEDVDHKMVIGAFGYHLDDCLPRLDGASINSGDASLMPRNNFQPYIHALNETLRAIYFLLNHDEVRIKTDHFMINILINDYKQFGLEAYLHREDVRDLKETMQLFDKIDIEFTSGHQEENIPDAYKLALSALKRKKDNEEIRLCTLDEFKLREDSMYWKNGVPRVYTDGSCENNGRGGAVAGCGVFWGPGHLRNASFPITGRQTSDRAEYLAVIHALETAIDQQILRLIICVDAQLIISSIVRDLPKWKRNGWMTRKRVPVKNRKLVEKIEELMGKMESVEFEKVLAHSGHVGNEGADRLAREAVEKAK